MKRLGSTEATWVGPERPGVAMNGWMYCTACRRAMKQEDCIRDEGGGPVQCGYDDCPPEGNIAFRSLYGWDAYRLAHPQDTADWPEKPSRGERYEPAGTGP